MMGQAGAARVLLDTNVLIYHLKQALPAQVKRELGAALQSKQVCISVITRIELLAWKGHSDASLRQTTEFVQLLPEFSLNEAVVQETIRVRTSYGLKLPDAVIAATAIAHGCQLWTGDATGFQRVPELNLRAV
jgi:toxin FitB